MTQTNTQTIENLMVDVSELPQTLVNEAVKAGVDRARWWMYPIETFWTTTIRLANYEFEIHKELNKEPEVLTCRKLNP